MFSKQQTKAFETRPIAVTEGLDPKTRGVPLRFDPALDKLQPVQFQCQVTVLDANNQKAVFWQAPIRLVRQGVRGPVYKNDQWIWMFSSASGVGGELRPLTDVPAAQGHQSPPVFSTLPAVSARAKF